MGRETTTTGTVPAKVGPVRQALRVLASIWSWIFLTLLTLVFFPVAWVGSLFFDGRRVFGRLLHWWARANMLTGMFKSRVEGLERVTYPAVIAANHQHFFDIMVLAAKIPPPVVFVSRVGVLKVPIVGSVLKLGGHILIRRGEGAANEAMLEAAVAKLGAGTSVIFFPEGTRSRDGSVGPFLSGAFRVAATAGCPLIPVAVVGTRRALPPGTLYVLPARLVVSFLEPRVLESEDLKIDAVRTEVRDAIVARLHELEPETGPRI